MTSTAPRRGARTARALLGPLLLSTAALSLTACSGDDDSGSATQIPPSMGPAASLIGIDTSTGTDGIVDLPATVDPRIRAVFGRYARLTAPSGDPIHVLAQAGVSDALIFRTRGILAQHLADVGGASLGADKAAVRDALAASSATLGILEDGTSLDPASQAAMDLEALFGDLLETVHADAMVQEGSPEYLQAMPPLDPTLRELAGFVVRRGVDGTLPAFRAQLLDATDEALASDIFNPDPALLPAAYPDAYLDILVDVYYGLWGHDPAGTGQAGSGSVYDFITRQQMETGDPLGLALMESFFSPIHTFPAFLDEGFDQTFEMRFESVLPYTHRSRYLERVGLRGDLAARVNGNELDNVFVGNGAENRFQGRGGNDLADMGGGTDVIVLRGPRGDYTLTDLGGGVLRIEDGALNRDGIDDVRGATRLIFSDLIVDL